MKAKKLLSMALLVVAGGVTAGEISCVTFTGTDYVQTDIVPTVDMRVVCDFQLLELPTGGGVKGVFGSLAQDPQSQNVGWGLRAHGPNNGNADLRNRWAAWSGNNFIYLTEDPLDTNRHVIELKSGSATFDGRVYASDGPARDPATVAYAMHGFDIGDQGWRNEGGRSKMRFFSMQVYRTVDGVETLVRDFVPYETDDGFFGIYDKVNSRFYSANGLLPGVWTTSPRVTPSTWDRRDGVTPVIDPGTVSNAATVTCSHTAEQLAALPVGSHRVTFTTSSADPEMNGRTESVVVTVTEPFTGFAADVEGRTVNLSFPSAAEARTLHLVYGTVDGGTDLAAWDHCVDVPVPAGTTSLQVNAPEGFGTENPIWSALLVQPAAAKSALSYVRHGNLVMQWDGEENAAYGAHDGALNFPVEIRRGYAYAATSGTMPAAAKSFSLGSGWFQLHSPMLQYLVNAGHATVEVVLEHGNNYNNGGIFGMGHTSRGFWYYQKRDNNNNPYYPGDVSYHARMSGDYECFTSGAATGTNTIACVMGANSNGCFLAQNGTKLGVGSSQAGIPHGTQKFQRYGTNLADDNLFIGVLPGNWFNNGNGPRANAKVCSIRVYDCVLTLDEVQANAAVDGARFRGENVEQVGPFFADVPLTVKAVNKIDRVPVSADLAFRGAARVRRAFFAWDAQDKGASLDAWAHVESVGTVPAGSSVATLPIPVAARASVAAAGGFRFFLVDDVSAASYVQGDHLVAQFDGIENGGFGVHDETRAAPAELRNDLAVTATGTLTAGDKFFRLGQHSFRFDCPALQSAINAGHATVELVLATNGLAKVNNGGYFSIGDANSVRGFWYYEKTDKFVGDMTYHGKNGDYDTSTWIANNGATNTLSFVLGADNAHSWMDYNGEKLFSFRRYTTDTDAKCFVGVLPGSYMASNYRPQALAFSIRLYDCVLSDAERARNFAIDRQRFRGEFACYEVSDYTRARPSGATIIVR